MLPTDIMAGQLTKLYHERRQLRRKLSAEESMCTWQRRWDESAKARWTHKLVKDVKKLVTRQQRRTDYFFTQTFSGHGCFGQHLYNRFGHDNDLFCLQRLGRTHFPCKRGTT